MTQLELQLKQLEQLKRTRRQLIDLRTTISNNLQKNKAAIDNTLRTITSLQQSPATLTKYETVVKALEGNLDALPLQPTSIDNDHVHSHEELQAIDYHFRALAATIAPDPHLHL